MSLPALDVFSSFLISSSRVKHIHAHNKKKNKHLIKIVLNGLIGRPYKFLSSVLNFNYSYIYQYTMEHVFLVNYKVM